MKRHNILLSAGLIVVFAIIACGGGQVATPAPQVATEPPVGLNTLPEASTLPIDLSGPPPGTPMVWVDGSILVHVPGSEFIMGGEGTDNPVHKVGLSSFWIYRTKVTNRMYAYCVAAGKCSPPRDPSSLKDFSDAALRDVPVAGVDWEQGDIYCKFVEGRLPTEAEWEKTARGTDGNVYPWGDAAPGCTLLNFNGNCVGKKTRVFDYPTGRSFYTALDMAGNAFEWTADWYDPNYYGASPVADPLGPEAGTVRSVRSSSYQSDQTQVPSYRRFFLDPKIYRPDLGFRCVVEDPHPFVPLCSQILVPGKLGNENLGGQPADPSSCQTPTVTINGKCTSATGIVTNGVLDSVEGGNCQLNGSDGFFCSGTGSTNVKVCIQCKNLKYPKGGECGIGQYLNTIAYSCDSKGQPGQCPSGFTLDSVNQCCTAGPGISYPGCGPGETLENNQCVPGKSKKPGCDYITVDLNQGCPTKPACEMTADSCNASCGKYGGNFNKAACNCNCIPTPVPSCTITADSCNASCIASGAPGGKFSQTACSCQCQPSVIKCLAVNTQIDTPDGPRAVEVLQVGDTVWTVDSTGTRTQATILKIARVLAPAGHQMVHIVLGDGRELWASPGHPTADGRKLGNLEVGDLLDGARVAQFELVPYGQPATYDLLPSGGTGYYWANGILTGSTLSNP